MHEEEPFSFAWQRAVIEIFASSTGVSILQEKTRDVDLTSLQDIRGCFSCRSAAESRRVCNADLLPQLSSPPNPTQHAFKEHQLAATLLRCASLQCASVGPCKTWPFMHDQPLARRPQLESRMTCKAVLASEDAQRASLFCFYLLSRA